MAVDPHTAKIIAKAVISQITDEEKRQRLIIGIIIAIVVITLIILIPIFAITSTIDKIKSFFGFGDDGQTADGSYYSLVEMHDTYAPTVTIGDLEYNGTFPMPVQNATVTCEFGSRIHPITGKQSYHTGMDIAGVWHSNITAVEKGTVVFAGVQTGYGNCVEIQHTTESGTTYYTFYAHLARIDVVEGQEIQQGTVIGIQGGDPNRDPNPGYSTGSHLHFEIRMSKNGDYINPREYLYGNKEV
jgi:murein DD-endopeptidase MepM/ murein hydrolase activator NlpD